MKARSLAERRAEDLETRRHAQREFQRPLVVEAGAGTGKTATLVARIVAWCLGPGWQRALDERPEAPPRRLAARVLEGVVAITFTEAAAEHPEVDTAYTHGDAACIYFVQDPQRYDVIVTGNLFGDILSDEAAMITGSLGMLPSASLGEGGVGLYEPVHGSAPDIAGQDTANPLAAILSAAMLLEHSLDAPDAANAVREAVSAVLADGHRTADIAGESFDGPVTGCRAMGGLILARLGDA